MRCCVTWKRRNDPASATMAVPPGWNGRCPNWTGCFSGGADLRPHCRWTITCRGGPVTMPAIASTLLSLALVATPDDAWQAGLEQWRQARAESLQREDGWLALVGLHWLEPGMTYRFGSAPGNDIVVDSLPALLGRFTFDDGVWSLQLEPEMGVQH